MQYTDSHKINVSVDGITNSTENTNNNTNDIMHDIKQNELVVIHVLLTLLNLMLTNMNVRYQLLDLLVLVGLIDKRSCEVVKFDLVTYSIG